MLYQLFFSIVRKESIDMGKNLKGKECGKGISQRKDGLYCARFVDKCRKRHEKYFSSIPEARNWLDEARYADKHDVFIPSDMTVDDWFNYWITNIVGDLAPNTRRNYKERYEHNIQPVIGRIKLSDVKPLHCKMVLNTMDMDYAGSTIRQAYITMGTMLKSALRLLASRSTKNAAELPHNSAYSQGI